MVVAINGSPKSRGNTYRLLSVFGEELKKTAGIDTEIISIGAGTIKGCVACNRCVELGRCVFDDSVNEIAEKIAAAEGVIIASPVYYAGINGTLKSALDRIFYSSGRKFRWKPAAAVVALRRGGGTAAVTHIQKYYEIAEMLQTPSRYWGAVHGRVPEDVLQDEEGIIMVRTLARNMAHLIDITKGTTPPEAIPGVMTNFIR